MIRVALAGLALTALLTSVGFAAGLGITPKSLTSFAAASTVPTSTCNATVAADATVDNANKNSNFGSTATLLVTTGNKPARGLVRFNLGCIPANAKIVSAQLSLYLRTAPAVSRSYAVYPITAAWTESVVTWNNQPGAGGATSTVTSGTSGGVTLQWNVATDVQAIANGTTNNGWRVADTNEGSATTYTGTHDSREGANSPALTITYWP